MTTKTLILASAALAAGIAMASAQTAPDQDNGGQEQAGRDRGGHASRLAPADQNPRHISGRRPRAIDGV